MWPVGKKCRSKTIAIHQFENPPKRDNSMICLLFSDITIIYLKKKNKKQITKCLGQISLFKVMGTTEAVKMSPA